ncbi:SET domain protein [Tolypocladium paradoxum]|uniref:SET domain protein n=1 Tax=Tolypocladium paradoxum TaxID=94208 RepID=A0A2S4KR25_9HYPO|nr:SET domain protein [Tolypocladium paradoxum]
MSSSQLPLDAFPAWARLNDVAFANVTLQHVDGKGFGLVADTALGNQETGTDALIKIPRDLVLSAEAVEEYAKVDQNFKQLLEAVGHQSTRKSVMLYLLCHLVHSRSGPPAARGITSTPWTEYARFLPRPIPVPTMWADAERLLLNGTSLQAALDAKVSALADEFDELREATEALPFWNAILWEQSTASFDDWVLADAWYRSRCLELPQIGDAMVPGLDMVNHSSSPTAYYDVNGNDDVVLLMRPGCTAPRGQEVTISYGEAKSAAEMLFTYGFIDRDSAARELTLHLDPFPDDPLAKAKLHVFNGLPTVKLSQDGQTVKWDSPFTYLMCLNEEDGLEFRLLQDTTGQRQLRLLWQGDDVTERAAEFEALIQGHDLCEVFKLRAVAVLHERVETQLASIKGGPPEDQLQPLVEAGLLKEECVDVARALKEVEGPVLEAATQALESEKSILLAHDHVVAHLGSMEVAQNGQGPRLSSPNEDEDFS